MDSGAIAMPSPSYHLTSSDIMEEGFPIPKRRKLEDEHEVKSRKDCAIPENSHSSPEYFPSGDDGNVDLTDKLSKVSTSHQSIEEEPSKPVSPIQITTIDFQSILANTDDESDSEVGIDPSPEINLSEDETTKPNTPSSTSSSTSSSSSSDEIEVINADHGEKKSRRKRNRRKAPNQRRNIKDVISHDQLDQRTLAAQQEEMARRERLAAKQKNLIGFGNFPNSMEQLFDRLSAPAKPIMPSLTPIFRGSGNQGHTRPLHKTKQEPELLTLSSDDEDCVPCYESLREGKPHPLHHESPTKLYGSDSMASRSRYSGGVMMVNDLEARDTRFDKLEEVDKKEPEVDDDDDDDCIILSPCAPTLEDEKDEDAFNVPDTEGRVLVNVGHPPDEPDIFLAPQIAQAVKPHQIGGIRFMYDNVVESLHLYKNTTGFGCILAHSMGLGKTVQAAALCDIFLNYTGGNTVLVIVPINTIQNWLNEFNYWLPPRKPWMKLFSIQGNCNPPSPAVSSSSAIRKKRGRKSRAELEELLFVDDSEDTLPPLSPELSDSPVPTPGDDKEESSSSSVNACIPPKPNDFQRSYEVFLLNETVKTLNARAKIISSWAKRRGILLIGYEMYRMLALKKLRKSAKRKRRFIDDEDSMNETNDEAILDKVYKCLVDPGPDLVICDEGHKIKNSGASISQALKAIRTRRRIVLTGYPLQNNMMEYHCMCDFIRPNYLGSKTEFANMFERPIVNGQCVDSTPADKRLMQFRSHVLHSLLEGFVQRRSHLVLQRALPRKEEWVFLIKMTPIQFSLYKEFLQYVRMMAEMGNSTPNPIKAFAISCKIWNHPDVLFNVMAKKEKLNDDVLEDLEDLAEEVAFRQKRKTSGKKSEVFTNLGDDDDLDGTETNTGSNILNNSGWPSVNGLGRNKSMKDGESSLNLDWSIPLFQDYTPNVLENGVKFELLFIIIEECVKIGDKLLIFSQSLLTLNLMEKFLASKLDWNKGADYFRLDGSTTGLERERLIKAFNKDPRIYVFLVSTRAGSLGINLIGANRVVVFDASWNPCHDCQAVCRIYRYGQQKRCHIYRFVTDGTLEKKIYDRQISKRGMANRVVDEMNPDAHFSVRDLGSSLLVELDDLLKVEQVVREHDVSKYDDPVLERLLTEKGSKITKSPFEHESLLIDRKEKKLSKAERRYALKHYEEEKKKTLMSQVLAASNIRSPIPGVSFNSIFRNELTHQFPIAPAPPGYNAAANAGRGYTSRILSKPQPKRGPYPMPAGYQPGGLQARENGFPASMEQLRARGISAQAIVLKKDSSLPDPHGGNDIHLNSGQKVFLFRSANGVYIKLPDGNMIAIRNGITGAAQKVLESVPPPKDLTKDQVHVVINSILRPRVSSSLPPLDSYKGLNPLQFRSSTSTNQFQHKPRSNSSPNIPPMFPYRTFQQNEQNLQITNHRSNSGGDVTIWKKDGKNSVPNIIEDDDLIPEIEVIKIHPGGESERIEPRQLGSEIHCERLPPPPKPGIESVLSFLGDEVEATPASSIYPQLYPRRPSTLAEALNQPVRISDLQMNDPFTGSRSGSHFLPHHSDQSIRNTQSPLENLRNTVSRLPSYRNSIDATIEFSDSPPMSAQTGISNYNSMPDSLFTKLLQSQHGLAGFSSQYNNSPPLMGMSEVGIGQHHQGFDRNPSNYEPRGFPHEKRNSAPNNLQYFTNGGTVTNVNEGSTKSIFTPEEQAILDRHQKEVL